MRKIVYSKRTRPRDAKPDELGILRKRKDIFNDHNILLCFIFWTT